MKSNVEPLALDSSCPFNYFSLLSIFQDAVGYYENKCLSSCSQFSHFSRHSSSPKYKFLFYD